jgi:hypothetical protein
MVKKGVDEAKSLKVVGKGSQQMEIR